MDNQCDTRAANVKYDIVTEQYDHYISPSSLEQNHNIKPIYKLNKTNLMLCGSKNLKNRH